MKSTINVVWHKQHRMPKHPTIDQLIEWHLEHLKNCQCRTALPQKLKEEMRRKGITTPV